MRSPGRTAPSLKNTDGPESLSTWPSMIDGPGCPGVGDFVNQAASLRCGPGCGTARLPFLARPMGRTWERTPIAGIRIETGGDAPSGSDPAGPTGAVVGDVVPRPALMRPAERGGCGALTCAATAT